MNGKGAMKTTMADWFNHLHRNTDGFCDVMMAMLRLTKKQQPSWAEDS